jgi:hypothetical protein
MSPDCYKLFRVLNDQVDLGLRQEGTTFLAGSFGNDLVLIYVFRLSKMERVR